MTRTVSSLRAEHARTSPIARRRPRVVGVDPHAPRAPGPRSSAVDAHGVGRVDHAIGRGRGVVVGVAAVAAVDEPAETGDAQPVGRRRSRRCPCRDRSRRGGARWRACAVAVDRAVAVRRRRPRVKRRPAEAGDLAGVEQHAAQRRGDQAQAAPCRRASPSVEHLLAELGRGRDAARPGRLRAARCRAPSPWLVTSYDAIVRPANSVPRMRSSTQRTFWPVTIAVYALAADLAEELRRARRARRRRPRAPDPSPGTRDLDQPGARRARSGSRRRSRRRGASTVRRERVHRVARQPVADLARFGVAHEHLVDDFVGAARARRVVRAVATRGCATRRRRARAGTGRRAGTARSAARARRSSDRSAAAHARCTSTRFDPTPISRFARAPERSSPSTGDEPVGRLRRQVLGERRDDELVVVLHRVRLGDDASEPRLRHLVVGAVHQQHVAEARRRRARCS